MVADEWLDQFDDIFWIMRSPDQDKVDLATYRFRGEASQWWKRYRENMEANGGHITREEFKTLFINKYFPSTMKDQKEVEFLTLQQGDMTVDEYVAKFESLARFCNNLQNQLDEIWKSKRFEQGLRPEVRNLVITQRIREYQTLIQAC